jgi:hypothetical protein
VPPDPKQRATDARLEDIVARLKDTISAPILTGKFRGAKRRGVGGFFRPTNETIRVRLRNDLRTITHEVGHFISHTLWDRRARADFYKRHGAELDVLSQTQAKPTREEGFAELVRLLATDQNQAQTLAPQASRDLLRTLQQEVPDLFSILHETHNKFRAWGDMSLESRLERHIERDPRKAGLPWQEQFHALYTGIFDDLHPIARAVHAMEQGKQLPASQNAALLAYTYRGWATKAAHMFLFEGQVDFDTRQHRGPGLSEILQPLGDNWQRFEHYGILRRLQELQARGDDRAKNSVQSLGTVLEMERDADGAFTLRDVDRTVADLETTYPVFKTTFEEMQTWNNALLDYLEAAGNLSAESKTVIADLNQSYFPFYRFLPDQSMGVRRGGSFADVPKGVKGLKGSGAAFLSPLEGLVRNAHTMTSIAERNDVGRQLAFLADQGGAEAGKWMREIPAPVALTHVQLDRIRSAIEEAGFNLDDGDLETVATIFGRDQFAKIPNEVVILQDGKPTRYEVEPSLYKALLAIDRSDLNFMQKFLAKAEDVNPAVAKIIEFALLGPPRLLRAGATLAPEFLVRNPMRDIVLRTHFTEGTVSGIPKDVLSAFFTFSRGLFSSLQGDQWFDAWERGGGAISALASIDRGAINKRLEDVLQGKSGDVSVMNPITWLRWQSLLFEHANRVAETRKALQRMGVFDPSQATKDQLIEAGYLGRDITTDFNRRGAWTGGISMLSSFWNAGLQGWDKAIRVARKDPKRFLTFGLAAITLPSLLLWLAQKDDKRYQEEPQWKKDISWILFPDILFPNAGFDPHVALRIPKPWEIGIIFGSIPERMADWLSGQGWDPMKTLGALVGKTFLPVPTTAVPLWENYADYSSFFNRPIEPKSETHLLPEARHGRGTSEISKAAGKFFGLSPRKIDNVIRSYTGGLGRLTNDVVNSVVRGIGKEPERPDRGWSNWPMVRGLFSRYPSSQAESVSRFYNEWENVRETWATSRAMWKRDGPSRSLHRFIEGHQLDLFRHPLFQEAAKRLSDLRNDIRSIEASEDYTGDIKQKGIDAKLEEMIDVARAVLAASRWIDKKKPLPLPRQKAR